MTIEKLSECKNASKFGTCTECGAIESEEHNLRRLKFNGVSVCLCQDCFSKTRQTLNKECDIEKDYAGLEEKHLGNPVDKTGIYADNYDEPKTVSIT